MGNRENSLEYWRQVEEELGERILGYALGQLQTSLETIPSHSYCLFFLTNTRLFIRYIPPERKILSLPIGSSSSRLKVQTISISREEIRKTIVQFPQPKLWNWLSPPLASVRISLIRPDGVESEIQFTMESKKNDFLRNFYSKDLP